MRPFYYSTNLSACISQLIKSSKLFAMCMYLLHYEPIHFNKGFSLYNKYKFSFSFCTVKRSVLAIIADFGKPWPQLHTVPPHQNRVGLADFLSYNKSVAKKCQLQIATNGCNLLQTSRKAGL